jgi:hypothetical protein
MGTQVRVVADRAGRLSCDVAMSAVTVGIAFHVARVFTVSAAFATPCAVIITLVVCAVAVVIGAVAQLCRIRVN